MKLNDRSGMFIDRSLNYGRHIIQRYLENQTKRNINDIVDIGAGIGDDLQIAHNIFPEARLHAIEIYAPYRTKLQAKGVNVYALDIEHDLYPFDAESIDIVIANQILEHVKEIFWVFHEVSRILRIGGGLIIGVPNLASLHNRLLLLFGRQPTCLQNNSAHVRGFTKGDIISMVNTSFPGGYEMRECSGSNFYPFPRVVAMPLARILPNMAWGLFMLMRKESKYEDEFARYPKLKQLETKYFIG